VFEKEGEETVTRFVGVLGMPVGKIICERRLFQKKILGQSAIDDEVLLPVGDG